MISILYAVLLMGLLGGVFGLVLAVAAKVLAGRAEPSLYEANCPVEGSVTVTDDAPCTPCGADVSR